MLNTVYQLVRPRQFEIIFEDIKLDQEHILVRPTHLSICNADQRYYQGARARDVLERKLPMALIHEGIGRVIYDPAGTFRQGERVIVMPKSSGRNGSLCSRKLFAYQQISGQQYQWADAGIYQHDSGPAGRDLRKKWMT